jgi:fructosamine-3-kinase
MSQHEHEIKSRKKYGQDYSEYIERHPEATLWTRVNSVENQISKLRQERRDLKERGADDEYIKAKADRIIELMDNMNEQISEAKK